MHMGVLTLFREELSVSPEGQLLSLTVEFANVQMLSAEGEDEVAWKWTSNGVFTVKSAYWAIKSSPRIVGNIKGVRSHKAPPRVKVFAWLAIMNRILTIDNLIKQGMCLVNRCVMCKVALESVEHILGGCIVTKQLQGQLAHKYGLRQPNIDVAQIILNKTYTVQERSLYLIAYFILWRERCMRIFRDRVCTTTELLEQIEVQWKYTNGTNQALRLNNTWENE